MKMKDRLKTEQQTQKTSGGIIHSVVVLDASVSMTTNNKYSSAVSGIREEIKALSLDTSVTHTYSLYEFSGGGWRGHSNSVKEHFLKAPLSTIKWTPMGAMGDTPLYDTTAYVITTMMANHKNGEKVIIKIFTDGGENTSKEYGQRNEGAARLAALIKEAEEKYGFTITFVGTKFDTEDVIRKLSIKATNTFVHDNTAAGVTRSFQKMASSTVLYAKSMYSGASVESLSQNFYTRTEEDAKKGL